jgi:tRNASer (uridine44-2'-O)-methyltransferase
VHLLTKENLTGFGVDVRKRKSWAQFQSQGTDLRQIAIDPSSIESTLDLLNGVDFLIGNHSDELTPWIPVIAARLQLCFF